MAKPFKLAAQASVGFSDASRYDLYRPSYPDAAVEKLLTYVGVANQDKARIVDLGCGTGKFTECLVARPEQFEVVAVEPHELMRETLIKKDLGPNIKVLDGNAGSIPVKEGWGDALIAAQVSSSYKWQMRLFTISQAFHWFATEESLKEIHRALRPGAAFGMIWNVEDCTIQTPRPFLSLTYEDNGAKSWQATTKWEQKLKDIVAGLEDGLPRFRDMRWKEVFEKQLDTTPLQTLKDTFTHDLPNFSLPIGEEEVKWTVFLTDDGVWSRYSTLSQIANLKEKEKEEVRSAVLTALKDETTERNGKDEVAVHGVTYLAWTSRI